MGRKVISIRIDEEIWKLAKRYALDKELTIGELVESSIIHEIQIR